MRLIITFTMVAQMALADSVTNLSVVAKAAFDRMPTVQRVDQMAGQCGADSSVDPRVTYCTTANRILVADGFWNTPQAPYLVAHAYGHAVQVQHGVADFALREIRNRRSEETMLRGLVERQVDCIAGFLLARADLGDVAPTALFADDPLDRIHWGRDPLRLSPQVSGDLAARAEWVAIGQAGDLAACSPGEFTADLLMDALRP
ncbi:hypothetical protein MWU60_02420 [Yoonia sp. F2084L]|uniref:hypothetical protein n=1 Tax=Yoonia sp. F2084L TaxID=2926419 RepID=UPI001FF5B3BC|nr:hypothetical protein [Yoonia sp. F2084L]MCK0094412.1 hypothetical protein [Yoonia sp. F2084L]